MILAALVAFSIYWHLPVLIVLVSMVYSATRYDDWDRILAHSVRSAVYMITFLGGVFVVLILLSTVLPRLA